jgi:putative acetyltransferase
MLPLTHQDVTLRPWQPPDRQPVADLISAVLAEYGLGWDPVLADRDVLAIEACYLNTGGQFWVLEKAGEIVGSGGYYPIHRGEKAVEIRKMYLHPSARGVGLGKFLLINLETAIAQQGWQEIWVETASILVEAVQLYEGSGYQAATGVETARCDRVYVKYLATTDS